MTSAERVALLWKALYGLPPELRACVLAQLDQAPSPYPLFIPESVAQAIIDDPLPRIQSALFGPLPDVRAYQESRKKVAKP